MAAKGAERREFVRLPLKLEAAIVVGARQPFACTVRDFCPAGMFVALEPRIARSISPNESAVLHIALIVEGLQREYQVRVVIARVVANGVGTAFVDPDPRLIQLLNDFVSDAATGSGGDLAQGFAPEYAEVIEPLLEVTTRYARELTESFLDAAEQALFLAARDAPNNADQAMYFDTQARLRTLKNQLRKDVPERINEGVRDLKNPLEDTATERRSDRPHQLSLVDKEDFEDFLTLSEIVSNIEPRYRDPLYELEQRMSYLANRTLDASINPLGPAVICNAFAHGLRDVAVDRRGLNVLYRSLAKVATPVLGQLIGDANAILVKHHILPVVERDRNRIRRPPASQRAGTAAAPSATADRAGPADLSATWSGVSGAAFPGAAAAPHGLARSGSAPGGVAGPPGYPRGAPGTGFGLDTGGWMVGGGGVAAGDEGAAAGVPAAAARSGVYAAVPTLAQSLGSGFPAWPQAISAGVPYVAPSFPRAYGAARNLMNLRRDLTPQIPDMAGASTGEISYSPAEVADGLTALQHRFGSESDPGILAASDVRAGIEGALQSLGLPGRQLDAQHSDAIEIIANLFRALVEDALVNEAAKTQLKRLQPSLHKVALLDRDFFEANDHPARKVLNHVASLRSGNGADGQPYGERVAPLIDRLNRDFDRDIGVFRSLHEDLERLLREQRAGYDSNVEEVTRACEQQQEMIRQHRGNAGPSGSNTADNLPVEWHRWLDRCREIKTGTDVLMNANRPNAQRLTVAWVGEAHDPFVFVDESGRKVQTLTLQQTAMYLRRGTLKVLSGEAVPAVDRALYGVLQRMHGQLEQEATHDQVTGFLNHKNFVAQIGRNLPDLADTKRGAILARIRLTELAAVNLEHGTAAGDALLRGAAAIIHESTGKQEVIYGRIDGADLGLYFRRAAVKGVQRTLEGLLATFTQRGVAWEGLRLEIVARCGLTEFTDRMETAEQLLSAAAAACEQAQRDPAQPICVAGQTETRQRQRLESVVAYVPKAIERQRLRLLYRTVRPVNEAADARPTLHLVIGAVDRTHKPIPPDLFTQAVANSEVAVQIDRWMISQALQWMSSNSERMELHDSLIVPLSAAALGEDLLTGFIIDELMRTSAPPGKICFAMNDADVLTHLAGAVELARTLHDFGCRFMLDEFGSGQSTYEYVRELKVDYVTIQSLFVRDAAHDGKDLAMVKSINELAHFMGKRTIARQAVAPEMIALLRDVGVDFIHELTEPLALSDE